MDSDDETEFSFEREAVDKKYRYRFDFHVPGWKIDWDFIKDNIERYMVKMDMKYHTQPLTNQLYIPVDKNHKKVIMNLWIFGDSYSCEWNIVTGERHKEYVKDYKPILHISNIIKKS